MTDDQNASPCISFDEFRKEVLYRQRYIRSPTCEAFLSRIKRSVQGRTEVIPVGETFWRAQIGHDWEVSVLVKPCWTTKSGRPAEGCSPE